MESTTDQNSPVQASHRDENLWAMLCHLTTFSVFLFPFGNILAPLVIWLIKKDEDAFIDDQAKEALNFQITVALATIVASILTPFLIIICIGAVLVPAVLVLDLVFSIVACVKANSGEAYRYPVCLRLIK